MEANDRIIINCEMGGVCKEQAVSFSWWEGQKSRKVSITGLCIPNEISTRLEPYVSQRFISPATSLGAN